MNPFAILGHRVRGFRVIDLGAIAVLTVLVLVVYVAKDGAGGTRADIDSMQQQIVETRAQIRLLQAEVAAEEQPERLASLSGQFLHLQPIPANHEVAPEALADLAGPPPTKSAPAPVAASPAAPSAAAAAPTPGAR